MRKISIIGIGAGNPDHLTIQAIDALNRVDVIFIPDKGAEKVELRRLRENICARFIANATYRLVEFTPPKRAASATPYAKIVEEWHGRLEASFEALLSEHLGEGKRGAFLVWGDPTLYDSTLRIISSLHAKGFALEYEVIPGISSVQALAARHRIPLNRIGEPVLITTGRRLAEGFANAPDSVVVMLDGDQSFQNIDAVDVEIFWGAYLGAEDEILISGKLPEVRAEILDVRRKAREDKGWIMDTYLLRKPGRD